MASTDPRDSAPSHDAESVQSVPTARRAARSTRSESDESNLPGTVLTTTAEVGKSRTRGNDCVVVIHSATAQNLGKRCELTGYKLEIGRDRENDLVLEDDGVSRRHSLIGLKDAQWYVSDLGSTNGTYVNDELVDIRALQRGDQIRIGATILKYLSGADLESQYHETIHRMMITDGLTGLHNKRFLTEAVGREVQRAHRYGHQLSLIVFELDAIRRINDEYGRLTGDSYLSAVAGRVRPRFGDDAVVARCDGAQFSVLLYETPLQAALTAAEGFRGEVETFLWNEDGGPITGTISLGCVGLAAGQNADGLLSAAADKLYEAKRDGGNRVAYATIPGRFVRRTLDGETIVHKLLAAEAESTLFGFEIADEVAVMAQRGRDTLDEWVRELERTVDEELPSDGLLGRWHDRYVLATPRVASDETFVARVQAQWESSNRDGLRRLRVAALESRELREFQGKALEQLALRLLGSAPTTLEARFARHPFPLAASAAWVDSATSELHRLAALVHAIEIHLQLAVGAALAIGDIADFEPRALVLLRNSAGRPATMGHWRQLLDAVLSLSKRDSKHPVVRWLSGLRTKVALRGESLPLLEHVNRAVGIRNDTVGHGAPMAEDAHAADSAYLREVLQALMHAAEPLSAVRLVSVSGADVLADEEGIDYELRQHVGASEIFPIRRERHSARLGRNWVYLLVEDHPPLSLSPIVFCATCEACQRTEVFFANGLVLGPRGTPVKADGVTTNHHARLEIQWSPNASALYDAVTRSSL